MADLSREDLIKIGVNPDNLQVTGEMNIIVGCFGKDEEDIKNDKGRFLVYPNIYHPRKSQIYSRDAQNDPLDITDEKDREAYVRHLKDSVERYKIMAYYLQKQIEEIEQFGYPKTSLYYPE